MSCAQRIRVPTENFASPQASHLRWWCILRLRIHCTLDCPMHGKVCVSQLCQPTLGTGLDNVSCAQHHGRPASNSCGAICLFRHRLLLVRLLPLSARQLCDTSTMGRLRLIFLLQKTLRRERKRGLLAHWSYDLARHRQLLVLYRKELNAHLTATEAARRPITVGRSKMNADHAAKP